MFISRSYFIGEINIPNTGSEAVGELLDWYIEKYEKEFLIKLLGYTNYSALTASDPLTVQKWIDLVEGVEYSYYSQDYTYYGLAPDYSSTSTPYKESPIANYIYYWFMRGNLTQTGGTGENKPTNENASMANPGHKMERAWNEMSKWEINYRRYVDAYPLVYTGLPYTRYQFEKINEFNI